MENLNPRPRENNVTENPSGSENEHPEQTDVRTINNYLMWRFILFASLVTIPCSISIYTTWKTVDVIMKLRVLQEKKLIHSMSDVIWLNQDVSVDALRVHRAIRLSKILSEQMMIHGEDGSNLEAGQQNQARIHINTDSIDMHARSYGFMNENGDYSSSLRLANKLDVLEAPGGIKNLKAIRGQSSGEQSSDIDIISNSDLEISGNMGLKSHSKEVLLDSKDSIHIESKEDSIVINSKDGLRLPNLHLKDNNKDVTQDIKILSKIQNDEFNSLYGSPDSHQLCIDSEDGRVLRGRTSGLC